MRRNRIYTIISLCLTLLCATAPTVPAAPNASVKQVQQQLNTLGYNPGAIDGFWGDKTKAALQQFQQARGLTVTGKMNEATRKALEAALRGIVAPADKHATPVTRDPASKKIPLRRTPAALTREQIVKMIREKGFHHPADSSALGLSPSRKGTFPHRYELRVFYREEVVIDHVPGLMWQQAAAEFLPGSRVKKHVQQINAAKYAGYADWRLPTVEELASLLATTPNGRDYIDSLFDAPYWFCLSADTASGDSTAPWVVFFEDGSVLTHSFDDDFYVLLVRSL